MVFGVLFFVKGGGGITLKAAPSFTSGYVTWIVKKQLSTTGAWSESWMTTLDTLLFLSVCFGAFSSHFFPMRSKNEPDALPCLAGESGTEVRNQTKFINNYKEAAKYIKILIVIVLFF